MAGAYFIDVEFNSAPDPMHILRKLLINTGLKLEVESLKDGEGYIFRFLKLREGVLSFMTITV